MTLPNKKVFYVVNSFLAGFSIMVVELISSRIVAPILGATVFTWTSVIGLTLLGLAIGGWVGGKVADSVKSNRPLPIALLASALSVALIPKFAEYTSFITDASNSILVLNLLLSFYLFFIPACAIGTIQPLLLKKYADTFSSIGTKYGTLSAAWSIGSMLGVFLTGFFLISVIGSTETIWLISSMLFLLGITYVFSDTSLLLIFIATLLSTVVLYSVTTTPSQKNVLFEKETNYYSTKVIDTVLPTLGESRILFLDLDIHGVEPTHSNLLTYFDMQPVFSYIKDEIKDILVLGGGAYLLPRHFSEYYQDAHVTVIETDPEMIPIANEFFNLQQYPITTVITDARLYMQKNQGTYDVIYGDTFNSYISVPWYLLTTEWNAQVRERLNKDGIYAINFISSLDGDGAELAKSITNTFKQTFPNYYVFLFGKGSTAVQNIVLVGINGDNILSEKELMKRLGQDGHTQLARTVASRESIGNSSVILTDDFSPIERLMSPLLKDYFPNNVRQIRQIMTERNI
ncbi:fused MFS/spermidine synthase [Candidatus Kaiserbacteria bacterium]|nr:MAG: fused MFS/spermidine synthase [Candidatus Kaiserbacteria bacterium]